MNLAAVKLQLWSGCVALLGLQLGCHSSGWDGAEAAAGSGAPSLNPSEWLNVKGPISWDRLKGRLILVEKWATW